MSDTTLPDPRRYIDLTMDDETFAQFRISDRVLNKWGRLFDTVLPSGTGTCCFISSRQTSISCELIVHKGIRVAQLVERAGSILQMNENLDVRPFNPTCLLPRRHRPSVYSSVHVKAAAKMLCG